MKKRILLISTMYPSNKHPSFGIFIKNQVKELENNGYKIDLLVIKDPRMGKINVLKKYSAWFLKWLYYFLFKGKRYDLVHAHYVFPSGFLAMIIKRFYNIPFIVTAHGGDIDKMAQKNEQINTYTKKILHAANYVIAVGELLRDKIINEYQVSDTKIKVMNMGVNRDIFFPQPKEHCREKLGLSKEKKILLFVGNIIEQKGVNELLLAYEELSREDTELHLVGAIKQPAFLRRIEPVIRRNNIQIHPPATQKEVACWMNAADILVIPSYIEGFGLVALEAMACQTPVIGTRVGGLQFLLGKDAGVLVEPKNAPQLKLKIEEVLNNQELQQRTVLNGEKKVDENDQNKLIQHLISIYQLTNST